MTDICTCGEAPIAADEAHKQDARALTFHAMTLLAEAGRLRAGAEVARKKLEEHRAQRSRRAPERELERRRATDRELERKQAIRNRLRPPSNPPATPFECRTCPERFPSQRALDTHIVRNGLERRHRCAVHGHGVPFGHCPLCEMQLGRHPKGVQAHFLQRHKVHALLAICAGYVSEPGERTIKEGREWHEVQGGRPESNRRKF